MGGRSKRSLCQALFVGSQGVDYQQGLSTDPVDSLSDLQRLNHLVKLSSIIRGQQGWWLLLNCRATYRAWG